MTYGEEARRFMTKNSHMLTEEAVEYAYAHADPIYEDDEIIVVIGADPSGRRFHITVSTDRKIIHRVRPL